MAKWTRDEDRSYAFWWFVSAAAFAGVSVLAVWDDGIRRAPWKREQQAFFEIERDLAGKNLDAQERAFARTKKAQHTKLEREQESLEKRRAGAEFRRWEEDLADLDEDFDTAEEDFTFAKSDQDEVYYYRTVAEYDVELAAQNERGAKQAEVAQLRGREAEHQKRMDDATSRMNKVDGRRRPLREKMAPTIDRIAAIEQERGALRRDLEDAQRRVETAGELSEEILQSVFRWRLGNDGAFIEEVDRCQTCHRGTDSGFYTDPAVPSEFRTHPYRDYLLTTHPVDRFGCTPCHRGQGRSTEQTFGHSRGAPHLAEHHGDLDVSWHMEGDHYWEEPMLSVGTLWRQPIGDDLADFTVDIRGVTTDLSLEKKTYPEFRHLLAELQAKLQTAIPEAAADAAHRDRFVAWSDGARVQIALTREMTDHDAESTAPPNFTVTWTDPGLGMLLGFAGNLRAANHYVAARSPEPTIQNRGPRGTDGLQVPAAERERLILSAPFSESGCHRCHQGDADFRPLRSVAEQVNREANHAIATVRAEVAHEQPPEPLPVAESPDDVPDLAPTLTEGRTLFRRLNCTGCHVLEGYPGNLNAGPTLDHVSGKVSPEWLVHWLRYPREWRPGTRMPNFWPLPIDPDSKAVARPGTPEYRQWERRRDEEVTALAAFLIESSTSNFEPGPALAGASVDEGRRVFETVGCRGCHAVDPPGDRRGVFASRERDRAPNLFGIGDKVNEPWLRAWVQNPAALWHGTRMPNLRLSDLEAANVSAYLMSLRNPQTRFAELPQALRTPEGRAPLVAEGRRLVAHYGCYGCHQIAGFEGASPIAPELTGHAKKDVTTLDFGYAVPDHHEQTWETFVTWKIDAPRMYERDRIPLRMADFDLSPREIRALLVFMKGLQLDRVSPEYEPESNTRIALLQEGRQLVEDYNCRGCHLVEGRGGDIRTYYGTRPEDLSMAPPMLRAQGFRVQPEWFYSFLRAPNRIRPWLDVRMPTFNFTEEQVTAVVRYFSVFDDQPFPYQRSPRPTPDLTELARVDGLVTRLQCTTGCHLLSDEIPPGTTDLGRLAPNLNMARERLRPEWISRWIENPAQIMPGTKMPQFFGEPFGDSPYRTDYAGDAQETIRALRDYLMNLDHVPAARESAAAAAAPPRPLASAGSAAPARQ